MAIDHEGAPEKTRVEAFFDERCIDLEFCDSTDNDREAVDALFYGIYYTNLTDIERSKFYNKDYTIIDLQVYPSDFDDAHTWVGIVVVANIDSTDASHTTQKGPAVHARIYTDGRIERDDGAIQQYSDSLRPFVSDLIDTVTENYTPLFG